jgi:hypothetical protein
VRLAVTSFSFTNEWLARRYTLTQLLRRIAALGRGTGIEVSGYQAWRSYPALSRDDVHMFRRQVEELELEPVALGAYVDLLRRVDRAMTIDEASEQLVAQVGTARELGFPLLKLHAGIPAAVLERGTAAAEHAGVILAVEIQGGQTPFDPAAAAVIECRERLGSPNLALTLDFSVAMASIPEGFADAVRRAGMASEQLERVVELWQQGATTPELFAALAATGAPAAALDEARAGFVRFGRQEPEAWLPLVPQIGYAHAKFWELDDAGDEPTVRNAELISVLRDGGYTGVVASEWGGNAWAEADDVDAFELTGRHLGLLRSLIENPAAVPA